MRLFAVLVAFTLFGTMAFSENLLGRKVDVIDGRDDRTSAAPLVIAMHGFTGTSRSMRKKTNFNALARKNGFVVAYPNGKRRRWNDGRSAGNRVDDVGFLTALIAAMVADGRADPRRVFLAGHSNGGGMAMRMACDRPDIIAGIAVVATKVPSAYQCGDGRAVPAIFFHGTVDPVAPHEGRPEGHRLGATLSGPDSIALWASRNKCRGVGQRQAVDRVDDGTKAEIIQYARCRFPLTYVLIEGHGHAWPGAGPRMVRLQGPASSEIDAAALSWWFFNNL